jgi:hypothetical protein
MPDEARFCSPDVLARVNGSKSVGSALAGMGEPSFETASIIRPLSPAASTRTAPLPCCTAFVTRLMSVVQERADLGFASKYTSNRPSIFSFEPMPRATDDSYALRSQVCTSFRTRR